MRIRKVSQRECCESSDPSATCTEVWMRKSRSCKDRIIWLKLPRALGVNLSNTLNVWREQGTPLRTHSWLMTQLGSEIRVPYSSTRLIPTNCMAAPTNAQHGVWTPEPTRRNRRCQRDAHLEVPAIAPWGKVVPLCLPTTLYQQNFTMGIVQSLDSGFSCCCWELTLILI